MHDVRRRPDTRAATGSRKRTRHFYAFVAPRTSVSGDVSAEAAARVLRFKRKAAFALA
jgi:hypothetical protein